jgi:hypothetical protein
MVKAKPRATIMVADGTGGLVKVEDRRFEKGNWPIQFQVRQGEEADTWMSYLAAECHRRDWSSVGVSQIEAPENSGSLTVNAGGPERQLSVVWERKRGGPIEIRARSSGVAEFPVAEAQEFFDQVNARCAARTTESVYWWYQLSYDGLPWCGELWLDDTLRLGPPSRQDDTALRGPRIVIVNALVDCINPGHVSFVFDQFLRELSAFLSVVMRSYVCVPKQGRAWTWPSGPSAAPECAIRNLGYMETNGHATMPTRGRIRSIPLRAADLRADGAATEESLRDDVVELWTLYRRLTSEKRRQFLRAAIKWQEALMHWSEKDTFSFALMVVACEALKPSDPEFTEHNIYQVIEALLGKLIADRLRQHPFPAQWVRSSHLHAGEFHGSELIRTAFMSSHQDPSFDEARRELTRITPAAIIEWLKRRGEFTMPIRKRRKTLRRMLRDYAAIVLPVAIALGIGVGWIARMLSYE